MRYIHPVHLVRPPNDFIELVSLIILVCLQNETMLDWAGLLTECTTPIIGILNITWHW